MAGRLGDPAEVSGARPQGHPIGNPDRARPHVRPPRPPGLLLRVRLPGQLLRQRQRRDLAVLAAPRHAQQHGAQPRGDVRPGRRRRGPACCLHETRRRPRRRRQYRYLKRHPRGASGVPSPAGCPAFRLERSARVLRTRLGVPLRQPCPPLSSGASAGRGRRRREARPPSAPHSAWPPGSRTRD